MLACLLTGLACSLAGPPLRSHFVLRLETPSLHPFISPSHFVLRLETPSFSPSHFSPSHSTLRVDPLTPPSHFTISLHPHFSPSHSTLHLDPLTPPSACLHSQLSDSLDSHSATLSPTRPVLRSMWELPAAAHLLTLLAEAFSAAKLGSASSSSRRESREDRGGAAGDGRIAQGPYDLPFVDAAQLETALCDLSDGLSATLVKVLTALLAAIHPSHRLR